MTWSRSRASNGGHSPNELTEQPKVTAIEGLISPAPSLPTLPIQPVPCYTLSFENFQQSTAHPVSQQAAVFSDTEGDDRSITSEETVILW